MYPDLCRHIFLLWRVIYRTQGDFPTNLYISNTVSYGSPSNVLLLPIGNAGNSIRTSLTESNLIVQIGKRILYLGDPLPIAVLQSRINGPTPFSLRVLV